MCDSSYSAKQERWNVYCTDVTFVEGVHGMSSRDLGCAVGSVFRRSNLADLLKYSAEVCGVGITTAGSDLLQCHVVVLQHKFRSVHPHQIEIVIEAHESFLPEESGDVVGREPEMMSYSLTGDRRMKVLLHI